MSIWFLCPGDTVDKGAGQPLRFRRHAAIKRHFPVQTTVAWEEVETLFNHFVVKVVGPDAALAPVRADNDFIEFDSTTVVPANRQTFVRNKLTGMGFTTEEVNATGFNVSAIIALLASVCGIVGRNQAGTGLEVKPGRRAPPKSLAQAEARLPG